MAAIIEAVMKILGLGSGSVLNQVGGVVNHLAIAAAASWAVTHVDDINRAFSQRLTFETSLGFLILLGVAAYVFVELLRRSRP